MGGAPRRFQVVLVKPSQYDDDGFLVRHALGTVPSNTLSVLHGLVHHHAVERRVLGDDVETRIALFDETVHRVPFRRVLRRARRPDTRTLVALCGVQTAQYPRALDLARRFLEARVPGLSVMIGGFHVSGSLALLPFVSDEIQEALDLGATVVKGEVERGMPELLLAAWRGDAKPVYDYLADLPDLTTAPLPRLSPSYFRRFPYRGLATFDAGRGCPFQCSFCTIIHVQGRRMRARPPETVRDAMRHDFRTHRIADFFFTDDNFARNPHWEPLLDAMIALREDEGIPVRFLMATDTVAHRIPRFVEKAARAGCFQVFLGLESLNEANLAAAQKRQNRPADFAELVALWRERGVVTQAGYIIGFPQDTPDSVARDVHTLKTEVRPELASFFMLTPLPGSTDHLRLWKQGVAMDPDLNRYDSAHAVTAHPRMTAGEWVGAYRAAWESFYDTENVRAILARLRPEAWSSCFASLVWYRQAVLVQHAHPLASGLWRRRDRDQRRPGFPRESLPASWRRRARDAWTAARRGLPLTAEMARLWWETRPRGEHRSRNATADVPDRW